MKILVINAGSSSLKFKLFKMHDESVLCKGAFANIGKAKSSILFECFGERDEKALSVKDHEQALALLFDLLLEKAVLRQLSELDGVGHRVVHGGNIFYQAQEVNERVLEAIKAFSPLAPLHNPSNLLGIQALSKRVANIRQVAVFDTAFHYSIPEYAACYALPRALYTQQKVRRYGFHGSSHAYILDQLSQLLNKKPPQLSLISLHLGNGASVCAIKAGKSVDTSMGMSPLEGLVMGTRSGDIDPSIIFYLHKEKGYSLDEIDFMLNHESGLQGICGESDMRTILDKAKEENLYAMALDIYVYRIKKYIGAYLAILGGIDAIVFTGGVGENAHEIRERIMDGLEHLGLGIDLKKNKQAFDKSLFIHQGDASVKVAVIKTDEELAIALETKRVLEGEKCG